VDALTDEEIEAAVTADPDAAPLLDAAWFAAAERTMPEAKQPVSIRLDPKVLDWFKRQGPRYQTRINAVLRAYVDAHDRPTRGPRTQETHAPPAHSTGREAGAAKKSTGPTTTRRHSESTVRDRSVNPPRDQNPVREKTGRAKDGRTGGKPTKGARSGRKR
jgi:uncharacterized protein (DUF4415 family)